MVGDRQEQRQSPGRGGEQRVEGAGMGARSPAASSGGWTRQEGLGLRCQRAGF